MENAGIVIAGIIYLIPIAGLIWKAATLASKVKENTKDIEEVKKRTSEQADKILDALQTLNDTMHAVQTDVAILKALRAKDFEKLTGDDKK